MPTPIRLICRTVQFFPDSRIERELAKVLQVPVPYNTVRDFPYGELGNRRFELLLYALFDRGLKSKWFSREFDAVNLAAAPSGSGRILVLYYKKQVRGAVLCRPRPGALTTPDLAREVIRFCLFHAAGQGLDFEPADFHLFLASSGGIQEKAAEYAADFNNRMGKEARLPYWTQELLESHPRLETLSAEMADAALEDILPQISLELILPTHLDRRLTEQPDIQSVFFGIEMVTSEQVLRKIVSDFNLKALDDSEAQQLVERLDQIPADNRMGAGLINFFGYPREFLQVISRSDKLRAIMIKGAEFKTEIDYAVVSFLHDKAVFFSNILLAEAPSAEGRDIGDLARLAVVPYVFSRFVIKYVKNANSKILNELVQSGQRKDYYKGADLALIKADLLKQVATINPDSPLPPDLEPRERKRREALLRSKEAYRSEEALAQRFDEDWEQLKPVLAAIDKRMLQVLPRHPTIVLDDLGALDQETRFSQLLGKVRQRLGGKNA